jgi:hypothetical protein
VGDQHNGKSVTFDQFDTTTYVHTDIAADSSFTARFILQVSGFELDGSPVTLPGFGSHYGMYFLIDATGAAPDVGADTFTSMNVALMVDPHNDDGALSASPDGIGFANGTADDIALATGTLKKASITFDGNVGHPDFFQNIALTAAGERLFRGALAPSAVLHELLTTPGGPNNSASAGPRVQWVDGIGHAGLPATAVVTLDPQTPLSVRPGLLNHDPGVRDGLFCGAHA